MGFLFTDVLVPVVGFLVVAWYLTSRKRQAAPGSKQPGTMLCLIGFVICMVIAVGMLSGLSASDGWMGNARLVLGLCAGAYAFYCLGTLIVGLIQGNHSNDDAQARINRARERIKQKQTLK